MPSAGQVPRARGVRQVAPRGVGPQSGVPQGIQGGGQRMPNVPMSQQPLRMPSGPGQVRPTYKFSQSVRNQPPAGGAVSGDASQGLSVCIYSLAIFMIIVIGISTVIAFIISIITIFEIIQDNYYQSFNIIDRLHIWQHFAFHFHFHYTISIMITLIGVKIKYLDKRWLSYYYHTKFV
jgi:hypothetical protein